MFNFSCHNAFNSLKKHSSSLLSLHTESLILNLFIKTDVLNYAFTTILLIVNKENEVDSVAFHFYIFTVADFDYYMHDKELLAIFKAFKI